MNFRQENWAVKTPFKNHLEWPHQGTHEISGNILESEVQGKAYGPAYLVHLFQGQQRDE